MPKKSSRSTDAPVGVVGFATARPGSGTMRQSSSTRAVPGKTSVLLMRIGLVETDVATPPTPSPPIWPDGDVLACRSASSLRPVGGFRYGAGQGQAQSSIAARTWNTWAALEALRCMCA
jgi:hypothetical protein